MLWLLSVCTQVSSHHSLLVTFSHFPYCRHKSSIIHTVNRMGCSEATANEPHSLNEQVWDELEWYLWSRNYHPKSVPNFTVVAESNLTLKTVHTPLPNEEPPQKGRRYCSSKNVLTPWFQRNCWMTTNRHLHCIYWTGWNYFINVKWTITFRELYMIKSECVLIIYCDLLVI